MRQKNTVIAVLFLCGLLGGLVVLVTSFFGGQGYLETALRGLADDPSTLGSFLVSAEGAANQDLDRSHAFIQLYGGVQRITGRKVVVDMADPEYTVVKLTDGTLAFQDLNAAPADQEPHAQALTDLRDYLKEHYNVPFLYVQAPQKITPEQLPKGMENYGNQNADQLLALLAEQGVDTLDLRPGLLEAEKVPGTPRFFFRTDHHWTPEAGFAGYQIISEELERRYGYTAEAQFTDRDQYEITTYPDWFLGSQGKRVGTLYAGLDGVDFWSPKFETNFTYTADGFFERRDGTFDQTLLFPERLEPKDYFAGNPYTLYSGGDYPLGRMVNNLNPDGPRILLIRESFACVVAPFLALQCGELMTMDMRYFKDDLASYIDWLQPDLVMVMYSASANRLSHMFPFTDYLS